MFAWTLSNSEVWLVMIVQHAPMNAPESMAGYMVYWDVCNEPGF